mgnify:FL=1
MPFIKSLSSYSSRAASGKHNICSYDIRAMRSTANKPVYYEIHSRQSSANMPILNDAFVNPGWSIHAKDIDTGELTDIGFIPIDTPPDQRKIDDISLTDGVWEVEVRLHQWYWPDCRWRKITTLVVGGQIIEQDSFSVIHNLRYSVEHFRAVLRWEVVDERNPKYHHFAIWFSDTTPIDTESTPADMLLHVPSTGTYKYDFAQDKPIYAAVAAINPEGTEHGPVSEIYCPWSLNAPTSPQNQQALKQKE